MPTNNFLPFASATGANVWSDVTYAGSSQQQTGIQKGIVPSGLMSKAWRQSAAGSAVMGQIITAYGLVDAVDDGNITGLAANYRTALAAMLAGAAFAVDQSATANVVTASIDPVPPNLSTYRGVYIRIANTNTGAATFALNNLGTKALVKKSGASLVAGDIVAGQIVHFIYDLTLGQWVLGGQVPSDIGNTLASFNIVGGNVAFFPSAGTFSFTVPAGVTRIRCRVWGGGGGGGSAGNSGSGAGGNGGGYSEGVFTVAPGNTYTVTVGAGGAGYSGTVGGAGGTGGTTSVGGLISATGGSGGGGSSSAGAISGLYGVAGATAGLGSGGQINVQGGGAANAYSSPLMGSGGAGAFCCSGSGPSISGGIAANVPGGGGGGGAGNFGGVAGGRGLVIVEY